MFLFKNYKKLLNYLFENRFKSTTNWHQGTTQDTLLLRHDVDFSIDYAYQLAQVEKELKVNSTYFFMLTSNMYNFLSEHNIKLVKKIANMGHKVSLHFDPTIYESIDSFDYEKNIFENIIKQKVDIVSIHRPGKFLDNNNQFIKGIPHTYQDKYFKKMKYISDSAGRDVFYPLEEYLKNKNQYGLHLLIHPIWWKHKIDNPTKTINTWRSEFINFINLEIRKNCKSYKG
jgi:hypothetical protein